MGNTCKPMAVSFQCMTKSTISKKKKEEGHSWISLVDLNFYHMHSFKRDTQRKICRGGSQVTMEAYIGAMWHKARNIYSPQKLGGRGRILPWSPQRKHGLDFRTVRRYIFVAVSHLVCSSLFQPSQEINRTCNKSNVPVGFSRGK